jgi:hypothetical protein
MLVQQVNSNHTSESEASELEAALARLAEAKAAIGAADAVMVRASLWASVLADADRWRNAQASTAAADSKPQRLWTARQLAKQAGISEKAARGLARKLPAVCVAPSHCCACLGGTRGCDLRFIANEADAWVNSQRRRRAAR